MPFSNYATKIQKKLHICKFLLTKCAISQKKFFSALQIGRFFLFRTLYIVPLYILLTLGVPDRTPRRRLSRGTRSSWSCRSGRLSELRMLLGRWRSSSDPLHGLQQLHERLQNGCLIRQPYKRILNPCIPTSHRRRVSRRRIMSVK